MKNNFTICIKASDKLMRVAILMGEREGSPEYSSAAISFNMPNKGKVDM